MSKANDAITPVVQAGTPWSFLLNILFVVLKVSHVVAWSWWIVLLPLWLPAVVIIGLFIIFGVLFGIGYGIYKALDK